MSYWILASEQLPTKPEEIWVLSEGDEEPMIGLWYDNENGKGFGYECGVLYDVKWWAPIDPPRFKDEDI